MRFIALLALCVAASFYAPPAVAQPAPSGGSGDSLRIATFNAYLLSPMFKCLGVEALAVVPAVDCLAQIADETESWAEHLADAILADAQNLDIIVINEAWDENAKDILSERLKSVYPVQVHDIDMSLVTIRADAIAGIPEDLSLALGVQVKGEDSGLMLFAKRGFRTLPLPDTTFKWGAGSGETLEATTTHVAFALFEDCEAEDCLAAKGAGLIRLQAGVRGPIYNVVFTHLQADYKPDTYERVRKAQLATIERLISTTLSPLEDHINSDEMVLVLGDLNIPYLLSDDEWRRRFAETGSFFRSPLYETMHFSGSRDDRTATNNTDRERLDYILASQGPARNSASAIRQRCAQHVTYPLKFRDLESDHDMVHADINRGFWHCSPAIARPVTLGALGNAVVNLDPDSGVDVTRIATGGAMQWFEVTSETAATYSIGRTTADVVVDIYLPEDLTTPVSRYNETPGALPAGARRGFLEDQYVLPKRFYVRVKGATRTTVANYALRIVRHDCATRETACVLQPAMLAEAKLSGETLEQGQIGYQDEAWFRFDVVGVGETGRPQTITLTAALAEEPRVLSAIEDYSDPLGGSLAEYSMTNIRSYTGAAGDAASGYLVFRQSAPAPEPTRVVATYETDISFITLGALICFDETNPELGSDEIFTRIHIDGSSLRAPQAGYVEFDCNNNQDSVAWWPFVGGPRQKAFVDGFGMQVFEEDDISDNDLSRRENVARMPADWPTPWMPGVLKWEFEDGDYRFNYTLERRPNAPVADF